MHPWQFFETEGYLNAHCLLLISVKGKSKHKKQRKSPLKKKWKGERSRGTK